MKTIILAAGKSTRMKSKLAKQLHKLLDRRVIDYVIAAAGGSKNAAKTPFDEAAPREIIVVTGHQSEAVRQALPDYIKTVEQKELLGTGHAVLMAADYIEDGEEVLVLCGDTPLITNATVQKLLAFHKASGNGATGLSTLMDDPTGYGRIIRHDGAFSKIVEQKDLAPDESGIREINTGVFIYDGGLLRRALKQMNNNNAQGEYYLTDVMEIIKESGRPVEMLLHEDWREFIGINNRMQLAEAALIMKKRINERHMLDGVTLLDPASTTIGADVIIGVDTVIYPGTILEGRTTIGEDCMIGPNCRITDCEVGDNVTIQYSVMTDSTVGAHTTVGPFAYLRPQSVVGTDCKIGDFVEVKNAVIGDRTKVSHLTYIGDADVGSQVNFGCGTVVVNYNGDAKFRTTVEDNVFIGCNTNLVAPVVIGEGAYTAAGSTITEDVPKKSLAIARARQINKKGWKKK